MGLLNLYISASQNNLYPFFNNPNDPTVYPATATGTPNATANPGAPPQPFTASYGPSSTYLNVITSTQDQLINTLNITNLDTTDPGVNGGIPYKQGTDPTIYPTTTNHTTDIRGFFPEPSEPSQKFNQVFTANSTYSEFIKNYI
jgi:hypothetical protein